MEAKTSLIWEIVYIKYVYQCIIFNVEVNVKSCPLEFRNKDMPTPTTTSCTLGSSQCSKAIKNEINMVWKRRNKAVTIIFVDHILVYSENPKKLQIKIYN